MISTKINQTFAIPEAWLGKTEKQAGRLNWQSSCRFIPIPVNYETEGINIPDLIEKNFLKGLESVVVILPHRFANGNAVKLWPDVIYKSKTGYILTAVDFADDMKDFHCKLKSYLLPDNSYHEIINASCQYESPYTQTLNTWVNAGARSYHPGDLYKYEFLEALRSMKGHWFYWGHSDCRKLRGYHHILTKDLLSVIPATPLQSTIWFSCSTINTNHEQSIALDWFLSGATRCMMACTEQINTNDNQILSTAFLYALQELKTTCLAEIIIHLILHNGQSLIPILHNYRLLGSPWIPFEINQNHPDLDNKNLSKSIKVPEHS